MQHTFEEKNSTLKPQATGILQAQDCVNLVCGDHVSSLNTGMADTKLHGTNFYEHY